MNQQYQERAKRNIAAVWMFTSELENDRAGSFRQERWCRVFLETGVEVSVFNVRGINGLTVASFGSIDLFDEFRRSALTKAKPRSSVREGTAVRVFRRFKHFLFVDLYLPNIIMLVIRARHRLKHAKGRIVIMSSSPPFSLALAGILVKAARPDGTTLVMDMRDAWATHLSLGGYRTLRMRLEHMALRRSDFLITASNGLRQEFAEHHAVTASVVFNVATHFLQPLDSKAVDWESLSPDIESDRVKLVYTGSTPEKYYLIEPLIGALGRLRREDPNLMSRIQLIFVGACDEVLREAKRHNITKGDIVFVPHVSHMDSRRIQRDADVLILLTYRGRGALSSKVFEYFAVGKPILAIGVYKDSDLDVLLTKYCDKSSNLISEDEILESLASVARVRDARSLPHVRDPDAVRDLFETYREFANTVLSSR